MQDRRSCGTVRDVAGWAGERPEAPVGTRKGQLS